MEELQLSHSRSGRIWKKKATGEEFSSQKLILSTFHGSSICPLAGASFSKNLKTLVINDRGKSYFLDFQRNQFLFFRTFRGVQASPCLLGKDIYSVQADGSPIMVRTDGSSIVESSHRHKDKVHSIEVARNPKDSEPWILMTSSPSEIRTWSAKTLKPLKVGSICDECISNARILHPYGKILVCTGRETSFDVLSLDKLTHHSTVEIPIEAVKNCVHLVKPIEYVCASNNGKYIVCGGGESSLLHLIDGESLQHIRSFEVSAPDSSQTTKKIKKTKKQKEEKLDQKLESEEAILGFLSMEFLPDGKTVCLVTKDGNLIGYSVEKPSMEFFLTDPLRSIRRVFVDSCGSRYLLVTWSDGRASLLEISGLMKEFQDGLRSKTRGSVASGKSKVKRGMIMSMGSKLSRVLSCADHHKWVVLDEDGKDGKKSRSSGHTSIEKKAHVAVHPFPSKSFAPSSDMDDVSLLINKKRLCSILHDYGEFPSDYRALVWRFLLHLPENRKSFENILHRAKQHPIDPPRSVRERRMTRVMTITSCFAIYEKLFAEVEFFPEFILPFVELFGPQSIHCFETVLTLVLNVCSAWFESHPLPPSRFINQIDDIIKYYDEDLHASLVSKGHAPADYIWPLMRSFMRSVLDDGEWRRFMDHMVTTCSPTFFQAVVVAYLLQIRTSLFSCRDRPDLTHLLSKNNSCSINEILIHAHKIHSGMFSSEKEEFQFKPLPDGGTYPVFNRYPVMIVNLQQKERDRIRKEHDELVHQQGEIAQMRNLLREKRKKQEDWAQAKRDYAEGLREAEIQARYGHEKLMERKAEIASHTRRTRLMELEALMAQDSTISEDLREYWAKQAVVLKSQYEREENDMRQALHRAQDDEELKKMEIEEMAKLREREAMESRERHEDSALHMRERHASKRRMKLNRIEKKWLAEDEEFKQRLELLKQRHEEISRLKESMRMREQLRHDMMVQDHLTDLKIDGREHERELRRMKEELLDEMAELKHEWAKVYREGKERTSRMIQDRVEEEKKRLEEERAKFESLRQQARKEADLIQEAIEKKRAGEMMTRKKTDFENDLMKETQLQQTRVKEAEEHLDGQLDVLRFRLKKLEKMGRSGFEDEKGKPVRSHGMRSRTRRIEGETSSHRSTGMDDPHLQPDADKESLSVLHHKPTRVSAERDTAATMKDSDPPSPHGGEEGQLDDLEESSLDVDHEMQAIEKELEEWKQKEKDILEEISQMHVKAEMEIERIMRSGEKTVPTLQKLPLSDEASSTHRLRMKRTTHSRGSRVAKERDRHRMMMDEDEGEDPAADRMLVDRARHGLVDASGNGLETAEVEERIRKELMRELSSSKSSEEFDESSLSDIFEWTFPNPLQDDVNVDGDAAKELHRSLVDMEMGDGDEGSMLSRLDEVARKAAHYLEETEKIQGGSEIQSSERTSIMEDQESDLIPENTEELVQRVKERARKVLEKHDHLRRRLYQRQAEGGKPPVESSSDMSSSSATPSGSFCEE
eukprot:TRINITY_DN19174_c0_g1_i1.p1 TRINITY_DN19174_c0_g1~~TRINITY_DN19174_c0_g1_i1.p1  ORF type:complete len:1495 (-),score=490.14 TRINITY_DN19174_c0_g1_i1:89-4573(-)